MNIQYWIDLFRFADVIVATTFTCLRFDVEIRIRPAFHTREKSVADVSAASPCGKRFVNHDGRAWLVNGSALSLHKPN